MRTPYLETCLGSVLQRAQFSCGEECRRSAGLWLVDSGWYRRRTISSASWRAVICGPLRPRSPQLLITYWVTWTHWSALLVGVEAFHDGLLDRLLAELLQQSVRCAEEE